MTEEKMTALCKEAMDCLHLGKYDYNPLEDDLQAMAMVKRFCLRVEFTNHRIWLDDYNPLHWLVCWAEHPEHHIYAIDARNIDLNRAIVECVAQMYSYKTSVAQGSGQESK